VGVGIKRLVGRPVLAVDVDHIFDHASNACFLIIVFTADASLRVRSPAAGSASRVACFATRSRYYFIAGDTLEGTRVSTRSLNLSPVAVVVFGLGRAGLHAQSGS
jgi:hypothetical protein